MTDLERRLMEGLLAFGWGSHDPWTAERAEDNHWIIHDTGFICPVCGGAAPDMGKHFPTLDTFAVPDNHLSDCPVAELLRAGEQ